MKAKFLRRLALVLLRIQRSVARAAARARFDEMDAVEAQLLDDFDYAMDNFPDGDYIVDRASELLEDAIMDHDVEYSELCEELGLEQGEDE